jgi:hypothetical protein
MYGVSQKIREKQACILGLLLSALPLSACGGEPATSVSSDPSRRAAPLAACVMRLPPRKDAAFMRQLSDSQYWKLVFPGYNELSQTLPAGALTCTGQPIFKDPAFAGAIPVRSPLTSETGDIVFGGGANRIKVVWIKTHQRPDGDAAGVLAIVRVLDEYAEVYSVGAYRGQPKRSRLGLERMGSELLITALDDRCTGRKPDEACDSTLFVYLPWSGRLTELAEIPLERVRFSNDSEPGNLGKVKYTLVTTPTYQPTGIKLLEQVAATDSEGRDLRKSERERTLSWVHERVVESDPSIWDRVFVSAATDQSK